MSYRDRVASQADEHSVRRRHLIFNVTAVLVVLVIIAVGWAASWSMLGHRITDTAIVNVEELAAHDEQAMLSSIYNRWTQLDRIASHIRDQHIQDMDTLTARVAFSKELMDCIRLSLVADDDTVVNSNGSVTQEEGAYASREARGDRYIFYATDLIPSVDGYSRGLGLGVAIDPIVVEGHSFRYIVTRINIDSLQRELKTDCYDGLGESIAIDSEGNYIIRPSQQTELINFYDWVKTRGEFADPGMSMDLLRSKVAADETFNVTITNPRGNQFVLCFIPMEETDWYFVMSVPGLVFKNQTASLLRIFFMLLVFVFASVALVAVIIIMRNIHASKLEKQYNQKLHEALDMAEQANRAKTTFLNNMSHDIRTPMNAIIGFTTLAEAHIDNKERVEDYLEKIEQSSNHLLSLINDVLDMSRIESGKMVLEEKPENLADILHGLRNIVQSDVQSKQLELYIDTVDVVDEDIYCDKLRLNQILLNIISNAVKFTQPGGSISVRISQTATSSSADRATYQFRVKDTGIGMSQEFVKTIFEPFTRERNSTVSGIQGTGLGMAITKNIVDLMGGKIEVSSEEDKGTEFVVTLSLRLQQGKHQEIQVIECLRGGKGLVVDDDINACQSVAAMLRQLGLRPDWTRYGREAIVRTEEAEAIGDPYKVYIIDWQMPDLDGVETARRIRAAAGADAPIILLSAYDWSDIEAEARAAGVTDFISKPMFTSELRSVLVSLCEEVPAPGASEGATDISGGGGRRLLLVEDNELNSEIATEILTDAGFVVETAQNGQDAVDVIKNLPDPHYYYAVLMDVQMPVMDGYTATKAIRALPDKQRANIPIIAMTANAFEEDRRKAEEAGMNAHVAKPINVELLLHTLDEVIKRIGGGQ